MLLQGFPNNYAEKAIGNVPENKLLSQAGNAMTVTTISAIAKQLMTYIQGDKKMSNRDLVELGSQTAKNGFKNEQSIADKFNNWENDQEAQKWLMIMN